MVMEKEKSGIKNGRGEEMAYPIRHISSARIYRFGDLLFVIIFVVKNKRSCVIKNKLERYDFLLQGEKRVVTKLTAPPPPIQHDFSLSSFSILSYRPTSV